MANNNALLNGWPCLHGELEELGRERGKEKEWVRGCDYLDQEGREENVTPYPLCLEGQTLHKGVVDTVTVLCA